MTFSRKDWRKMRQVVRSPFFNQRTDVIRLLDFLEEQILYHHLIPDKEEAHRHVYKKKPYNAQEIRQLMSFLYKNVEQYLSLQEVFEDSVQIKTQLAAAYRKRSLDKAFLRTIKEAEHLQSQQVFRNADFYQHSFLLQQEKYHFTASQKRLSDQNLQEISDNLDVFFIAQKLRQACLSLSHQAVYKKEYTIGLLDEILAYAEQERLLDLAAIAVYYYAYKALSAPSEHTHFQIFKQKIYEEGHLFPHAEIKNLYLLAINYCIKQVNQGAMEYFAEGLDLYKQGLKTQILLENKQLSRFTFLNIVAMGLKVGDLEWVEQFIHQYHQHLNKAYQEGYYNFSLARLAYRQQDYQRALKHLGYQNFKDQLLVLAAKTIQLKIYYETDEIDLLEAHLEAMDMYVRRKKILAYHQSNYQNIIRLTKKLLAVNRFDKEEVQSLQQAMLAEEILTEREWLLQQLERF